MAQTDKNSLLKALGIEKLPQEEREEILAKVDKRLEDVVIRTVIDNLSEEETKEFLAVLEKGFNIEENVARLCAGVPLLSEKMELAVAKEIDRLKTVLS